MKKEYIDYLKKNPKKLLAPLFVFIFGITINIVVNYSFSSLALSFFVGFFSSIVTILMLLQVWGEYKGIEGLLPTIKEYFKL